MTAVCCGCACCATWSCRRCRARLLRCGAVLSALLVALGAGYAASWGLYPGSPILGAALAGAVLNWAGRRVTLGLSVPLQAASLLLLALGDVCPPARSACAGAAVPLAVVPGLFYLSELSRPWRRGAACSGVVMAYLAGRTLPHTLNALLAAPDALLGLAGLAPGLLGLLLLPAAPPSPYFLALRGRAHSVPRVLARLRGLRDETRARAEADELLDGVREQRAGCCAGNLRGPVLAVLLCGSLPLLGGPLIESLLRAWPPQPPLPPPHLLRAACGLLQLAAVALCVVLVDRIGRRGLVLVACGCVALGNATCGYFLFFLGAPRWTTLPGWISFAGLALSVFGQGLLAGVAWVLFAEILPLHARCFTPVLVFLLDGIIQTAVGPLAAILVEEKIISPDERIWPASQFWGCALWSIVLGVSVAGALFETKGCTLSQTHVVLAGPNRRNERTRM